MAKTYFSTSRFSYSGLNFRSIKAFSAVLLSLSLLLCGCASGGGVLPQVLASGPLPFPAISAPGMTITLEPGTYACPGNIPSGTRIIGASAIVPPELIADKDFAPLAAPNAPIVRIMCPGGLSLKNLSGLEISGVVFDFQGTGGLVLDSTIWSRFDLGIVNASVALTLQSNAGNVTGNTFPRVVIYKADVGILLQGFNSTAVTWNDFGHVDIVRAHQMGIDVSQFSDTNTFQAIRTRLDAGAAAGLVFNDHASLTDVDAGGNIVAAISCDGDAGYTGFRVDFRGATHGNSVTVAYGIMPDANKVHFDNAASQSGNIVVKLTEHP